MPKELHKLTNYMITPSDRQNVETVIKVSDISVINLMAKEIPNSEGTVLYLRVINNVLRAFLDITL